MQMTSLLGVTFLALIISPAMGKTFQRCELAKLLKASGMDGYRRVSLPNWVCMASFESRYDTMARNYNRDGSTDYGIFQINSRWWCEDGETPGSKNACKISCNALQNDDITDDIKCAKRVVQDPNGMRAWVAWRLYCAGKDLTKYLEDCDL
ncbi:lysozyme C, kidney isozyme-like [Polypterus senegalus]|uniref:lysozyme C, kidney isozyme-like n=1 Tax=Polypterus senegalus TaxID=55291 RepID=UPI00196432FC|nr:lysozyme C, kidney isozyme-like [Polypterus senegalus]